MPPPRRAAPAVGLARGALLGLALVVAALGGCSDGDGGAGGSPVTATPAAPDSRSPAGESPTAPGSSPASPDRPGRSRGPRVVGTVADGLAVPWGLAFLPDGSALVTERDSGRVLVVAQGEVAEVGRLDDVAAGGEAGLLGVAVSPSYGTDRQVFFYLTTAVDNRIVRATYAGGRLRDLRVILDGIPQGFIHDGGRLAFGPDGLLYASTGETGREDLARDRGSLGGKILRLTADGAPAPGNPFPDSPVWSYGHRNVQGLAFDEEGRLWASEFGSELWDELNLIAKGVDYGWPLVEGVGRRLGMRDPQVVWRTDEASPSGLAYLDGRLWLAALRGQRLWRIDVTDGRAGTPTDFFVGDYGRLRTVVVAPDGMLWVTTSNRDGRGTPSRADDRILLVDPG